MWAVNLIALLTLLVLAVADPKFPAAASQGLSLRGVVPRDVQKLPDRGEEIGQRESILMAIKMVGLLTITPIVITLFAGVERHRRLRKWFAFTALVAAWLTLFVSWPEIAWQGQRMRLWTQIDDFEPVAAELRDKWPGGDGELPKVGAFMAYPQGKPRTLLMLAQSEAQPGTPFSAVERDDDGSLKFELAGDETGSWLEWHPAGSAPENFTGGLENTYTRGRSAPLGNGWYLVRYR
jgi:hypothetical protein